MSDISKTSEATFPIDVLKSTQPVLVDFGAEWCGPCKMLDPVVQQLAQDWAAKVKFYKIDVDDSPNLAMQYSVMGVPTLMLFIKGQPVERITGYNPKDRLVAKFSPHLR